MSDAPESTGPRTPGPAREPSGLVGWLDVRTGLRARLEYSLRRPRLPSGANRWSAVGGVLLFAFALQLATGALLLVHFVPDPAQAFESVRTIMREIPFGWLIRLVHAHTANLIVILLFFHLYRSAFAGAYKKPRELVWMSGYVLFGLLLMAALTGYILPWSQTSYWATTIVTGTVQYLPVVGEHLVRVLRGGEAVGPWTYRRAFAAHVAILPMLAIGGVALHLLLIRRVGVAPAPRRAAHGPGADALLPFVPRFALRYAISIALFLLVLLAGVFFTPHLYFPAEAHVPANPLDTPAQVRPEWYFLWAYELPRLMPSALALTLQGLAVMCFFALPFLDRSPHRHPLDRPVVTSLLALSIVIAVALSVMGWLE